VGGGGTGLANGVSAGLKRMFRKIAKTWLNVKARMGQAIVLNMKTISRSRKKKKKKRPKKRKTAERTGWRGEEKGVQYEEPKLWGTLSRARNVNRRNEGLYADKRMGSINEGASPRGGRKGLGKSDMGVNL